MATTLGVGRIAGMAALAGGAFALQVAVADHFFVAPVMEVVACVQERALASAQPARPHFEEEIVVVARSRSHRAGALTSSAATLGARAEAPPPVAQPEIGPCGVAMPANVGNL